MLAIGAKLHKNKQLDSEIALIFELKVWPDKGGIGEFP